jgi:hypothetical protein
VNLPYKQIFFGKVVYFKVEGFFMFKSLMKNTVPLPLLSHIAHTSENLLYSRGSFFFENFKQGTSSNGRLSAKVFNVVLPRVPDLVGSGLWYRIIITGSESGRFAMLNPDLYKNRSDPQQHWFPRHSFLPDFSAMISEYLPEPENDERQ